MKGKQNSHDSKEEIFPQKWSGKDVGEGCIIPYGRNEEITDTECENRSDNKTSETQSNTMKIKLNSIINTTTEQRALTCFTIDAILKKTEKDKRDDSAVSASKNNSLKQWDAFHIKSENLNDNTEMLQSHKVPYSSIGTSSTSSEEDQVPRSTNQSPSCDSSVFFDNDVDTRNTPTSHFLWMSPVTPFYPLQPHPSNSRTTGLPGFCSIPHTTGLPGFCSVQHTTGLASFYGIPRTTGVACFRNASCTTRPYQSPHFYLPAPQTMSLGL